MRSPRSIFGTLLLASLLSLGVGLATAQDGAASLGADRDWQFIERLRDDGMYDVAARQLIAFSEAHPQDPRAPQALFEAASVYRRLDQAVTALATYELLLRHFPTSKEAPRALLQKAELLSEARRYEEAAAAYRSLLTSFPASPQADPARLGLGEASMAMEQNEEASRLFRYLVGGRAAPPLAARAQFDLGVLEQKAGNDSLAVLHFDAVHQRFPEEVIGAFGLLRSAELLTAREAPVAARQRYETVLADFNDPYIQARAELGLAILDEAAEDWKQAAKRYRAVAERGGSPEQVQLALLGLGESELRDGREKQAREAAQVYLEKYPQSAGVSKARLLKARADVADGKKEAEAELEELSDDADAEVAWTALTLLAELREPEADGAAESELREARELWRQAASRAPDATRRAAALAEAARITSQGMQRHALAAEFYHECVATAELDEDRARYLGHALAEEFEAGEREYALSSARRLAREYPLSPEASVARALLRAEERRRPGDPREAVRRLAEVATQEGGDPQQRQLEVGILLREMAGDPATSARILRELQSEAATPELAARAGLERGRSEEASALAATLDGDDAEAVDRAWSAARAAYLEAAGNISAERVAGEAKVALVRMELAEAAQDPDPVLFDTERAPLYRGVGAQEALALNREPWPRLAQRLRLFLETVRGSRERSWLLWRSAEISVSVAVEERIAWVEEGLSLGPSSRSEPGLRYTLGQLLLDADRGDEAASQLRRVMEDESAGDLSVAARYAMAEIQRKARRYTAAQGLYEAYAGAYPSSQRGQRALLLAGDMALYAGDADRAAEIYRSLLAHYEDGVYADDAAYRLGTAQMRRGRDEDARSRFRLLAAEGSGSRYAGRSLLKLSELESRAGHDSLAVDALERLTAIDPELAAKEEAPKRLAELELERERPREAMGWLDRIVEDPPAAGTLALRIRALALDGRTSDAEQELARLSEGYPDAAILVAEGRCDLADSYLRAGRAEDALAAYARVEEEPAGVESRARALHGRGMALLRLERFAEARVAFEDAARAAPQSEWAAQSLYKVANIAARQGEDEVARDAYRRLAEDFSEHELAPGAMRGLATSYRRLGRYDKALEVYHELLEKYPELPGAETVLSSIAYSYHEMGRFEVCIAAYERVLPLLDEEEQAYAQFWIADSLEQLQRHDEAAAAYLKIPYLYPKSGQLPVTAQLKAAGVYETMGEKAAATTLYQKVITTHGRNSQWGAEAVRRLERLQAKDDGSS